MLDWNSLDSARRMSLDHVPETNTGRAFCEAFAAALAALGAERKYQRRGERKRRFELAAGAVAADLLKAAQTAAARWSYRSLMAVRFTGAPISYADFTSVVDAAGVGGFVERHKGHYQ